MTWGGQRVHKAPSSERGRDGQGEVRLLPRHPLAHVAAFADLAAADLGDHVGHGAAGDALGVASLEGAEAPGPPGPMAQGLDLAPDLLQGQRPRLLRPRRGEREGFRRGHILTLDNSGFETAQSDPG